MSRVHPIFQPLHDFLAGKPEAPAPVIFHFDTEVRAEFVRAGEPKFAIAHLEVDVEADTEDAACTLAARQIMQDLFARIGSLPTRVEVIRSEITMAARVREDAHG